MTNDVTGTALERIRILNDRLRQSGAGGHLVITAGLSGLGPEVVASAVAAVTAFEQFTPDNDPYGEHDCAVMQIGEDRIIWKIDYYDLSMTGHSPDPADALVTTRVLTIMLADEY